LKALIPRGSDLRLWLGGEGYEPTHSRQRCDLLMLYPANMAGKLQQQVVVEAGCLAAAAGDDGQGDDLEEDAEEWEGEGAYEDEDEYIDEGYALVARMSDSRQTKGVRPPLRQSGPPCASAEFLAQAPACGQRKGRHRGKCPIQAAQKDSHYDRRTA